MALALLGCLLLPEAGQAQSRGRFGHLDRDNGLTSDVILATGQDTLGFMWFGTPTGLNRYDGVRVQQYLADPLKQGSIPNSRVNSLFIADSGDLWIGTHAGIARYRADLDGFESLELAGAGFQPIVLDIDQDSTGVLWLSTWESGLFTYDPASGAQELVFPKVDSANESISRSGENTVRTLLIQRDGRILLSGSLGVFEFNPQLRSLESPPFSASTNRMLAKETVFSMVEDAQRDVWISTFSGIIRVDSETGGFRRYSDGLNSSLQLVYSVLIDTKGTVWAGSAGGLLKFNPTDDRFEGITHNATDPGSIQDGTIGSLFEDSSGVLWIGSNSRGASTLDLYEQAIPTYMYDMLHPTRLPKGHVWDAIDAKDGGIWLATESGLNRWMPDSNLNSRVGLARFSSSGVRELFRDVEGRLWVAPSSGGLCIFDESTFQCEWVPQEELPPGTVNALEQDDEGWIWVGTTSGIVRLDPTTLSTGNSAFSTSTARDRIEGFVMAEKRDSRGMLWVGSEEGLFRLIPGRDQIEHILIPDENGLPHGRMSVVDLVETSTGDIWFLDRHIHKWAASTGQISTISVPSAELANGSLRGLALDKEGRVWIQFDGTIVRLNEEDGAHEAYPNLKGRMSLQTWKGASSSLETGDLIFGFENGVYYVTPDAIEKNTFRPKVLFTALRIGPSLILPTEGHRLATAFQSATEVKLNYDDRSINIEFASTHFGLPSENSFRYAMEGLSDEWIDTKSPMASFSMLDPGTYWFRVITISPSGVTSPEKVLKVLVDPPWWATMWFRLLTFLAIVGMVGLGIRFRVRAITEANHRLEEMVAERTVQLNDQSRQLALQAKKLIDVDRSKSRFFSNVSHELKTPLTLIRGYLEELEETGRDRLTDREATGVSRSLSLTGNLDRLVLQLLDLARSEANRLTLNSKRGELASFVHGIVRDFSGLAEKKHIQLILEIEEGALWMEFDSVKLHQIVSNLMANALKFTPERGKIWVSLAKERSNSAVLAVIQVADTGPGISSDALELVFDRFYQVEDNPTSQSEGFGIGLSLSHDFAQLHGGSLTAASELGMGSVFTLKIPIGTQEDSGFVAKSSLATQYLDIVSADQEKPAALSSAEGQTVLVVEDNTELRQFLKDSLSDTFTVLVAENGAVAWQILQDEAPDIVLSDIMMPEMNGLTLLKKIRQSKALNHLPVVLLTARGGSDEELEGINAGANDYIAKPFNARVLKARMANLVAMNRTRPQDRPESEPLATEDQQFLKLLDEVILGWNGDSILQNSDIADALFMTERTLQRRIKELTDESLGTYLRKKRLMMARRLLEQKDIMSVSRVARSVGFSNVSHFSKIFFEEYGVDPSYYMS